MKINNKYSKRTNCGYAISPECYGNINFLPRAPVIIEYYQFIREPLDGKMISRQYNNISEPAQNIGLPAHMSME